MPYFSHTGIIYAAGVNRRLADSLCVPLKGLFNIEGDLTLIILQAHHLIRLGIDRLVLVVGLEHQLLIDHVKDCLDKKIDLEIVYNKDYANKGNMLSFWVARGFCNGAVTFTTSDLYLDGNLPKEFSKTGQSMVLVDDTKDYLLADPDPVKVSIQNGFISRIHKHLTAEEAYAVNPGFYHYNEKDTKLIFQDIAKQIEAGDDNQSLYLSLDRQAYKMKIIPCFIGDAVWFDVDTPEDLERLKLYLHQR